MGFNSAKKQSEIISKNMFGNIQSHQFSIDDMIIK